MPLHNFLSVIALNSVCPLTTTVSSARYVGYSMIPSAPFAFNIVTIFLCYEYTILFLEATHLLAILQEFD